MRYFRPTTNIVASLVAATFALCSVSAHASVNRQSPKGVVSSLTAGKAKFQHTLAGAEAMRDDATGASTTSSVSSNVSVGWDGKSVTMFEGTSSARGRSTWNRGASATYDKGVAGRLVALGTTLLDTTGSSCGSTVCIDQHPGFSVSKKVNVIDFTIAGVGVTANLVMSGSIGMDIVATGAASTTNLFVSAARVVPSADFSAGCELSVGLLPFGLADLKFSEKLQVAKAQGGPKVANRLFHHSSTDVDVGWQNEATETLSTGAGKIEAQACSVLLGCGFKTTLATWDAFASTTKTYWTESGSLDDQKAW